MKKNFLFGMIIGTILASTSYASAQEVENDYQTRLSATAEFNPIKKLSLETTPQFQINDDFILDECFAEINADYKIFDFLSTGSGYRLIANTGKDNVTDYYHRYSFNITFIKKIERFKPSFRTLYTNYINDDDAFLRYRAKVKYNISGSRLSPFISCEPYQSINKNEFHKIRYSAGVNYKLFKKNSIGVDYKLDYFLKEYKNRHIFSVGYKIKL